MGFVVIPGSKNVDHIKDNLNIMDFELTEDEMAEIAKLNKGERYFDENLTFTNLSGKKQTRKEFIGEIMDGTLNYFKVDTKDYSISVNGDTARMKVIHTLTAKVYGISGNWTMSGENTYKRRDGIWIRVE